MNAADLEHALTRLANRASQMCNRMDLLAKEIQKVRAGLKDISATVGIADSGDPASNDDTAKSKE